MDMITIVNQSDNRETTIGLKIYEQFQESVYANWKPKGEAKAKEVVPYSYYSKAELISAAKEKGIKLEPSFNKAQIQKLLEDAES